MRVGASLGGRMRWGGHRAGCFPARQLLFVVLLLAAVLGLARPGLAVDLVGNGARRYVAAFARHLQATGQAGSGKVYLARDYRESSPAILADCAVAVRALPLSPAWRLSCIQ